MCSVVYCLYLFLVVSIQRFGSRFDSELLTSFILCMLLLDFFFRSAPSNNCVIVQHTQLDSTQLNSTRLDSTPRSTITNLNDMRYPLLHIRWCNDFHSIFFTAVAAAESIEVITNQGSVDSWIQSKTNQVYENRMYLIQYSFVRSTIHPIRMLLQN